MAQEKMTLANIGGGALVELFDREMQKVLANIRDPNSDVKKASSITIKVTIKPNENRGAATMNYSVESKKSPARTKQTGIRFGVDSGEYIAKEIGDELDGQQEMNIDEINKRRVEANGNHE